MRPPQEKLSQRQLVYQLALAIDLCRNADMARPGQSTLRWTNLNVLLDENPKAARSTHVLHNIGARRRQWLREYVATRGARVATSI